MIDSRPSEVRLMFDITRHLPVFTRCLLKNRVVSVKRQLSILQYY